MSAMITFGIALTWLALATGAFAGLSALARLAARSDRGTELGVQPSGELPGIGGEYEPVFASRRILTRYARSEML
jgi:hypothetical protein